MKYITAIYVIQFILGVLLWRRFKFNWKDSVLFSLLLIPNVILVSIIIDELFSSKISFVQKKLYRRKNSLNMLDDSYNNFIKCTGNNGNGCFMDSCGHNCGCEGLKKFSEKIKQ